MISISKSIVIGIDGTLCPLRRPGESYQNLLPRTDVLTKLQQYRRDGFYIILYTSRSMRTFEANMGLILANTAHQMFAWLEQNGVPYDEIHFGRPWAGDGGFYVDDRAIRPEEFVSLEYERIQQLVGQD